MIRIEFPADRADIALAIGRALATIGAEPDAKCCAERKAAVEALEKQRREELTSAEVPVGGEVFTPEQVAEDFGVTPDPEPNEPPAPETLYDEKPGSVFSGQQQRVDGKGVPFNAEFCGEASEPFYQSGACKGQWKKKRGVDDSAYQAWYTGELSKLAPSSGAYTTQEPPQFDASSAWAPAAQQPAAPQTAGLLFAWIAENQTAGNITGDHVAEAYAETGVQAAQLFTAAPAGQAGMCGKLHAALVAKGAK